MTFGNLWRRQSGVALPDFNATDVWFAPNTPINSTAAFSHASHLEDVAYAANRYLFIVIMAILCLFVLLQLPHTFIRMRQAPRWYWGATLLANQELHETKGSSKNPPRLLAQFPWRVIPNWTIPGLRLPLREGLIVAILWFVGVGLAGWCQASFLTDASRSTLLVMALTSLAAALGVKAGGVGSWLTYGYTTLNYLHRWTGRLVLLLATLHVIAYLVVFYKDGIARVEMAKPENYLGAVAYGGLCLTGIVSIRPIRRKWWLFFKFGHHFGILLLLAGLNYHSPDVVPYLLAVWAIVIIDAGIRAITTRLCVPILKPLPGVQSTLFSVPYGKRGYFAGSHIRVRVIKGFGWKSTLESHPFTIASEEGAPTLDLIIKDAGDWTHRLFQAAERGEQLRCSIEGPYGGPQNFIFPAFKSVLLVVGGSGISFGLSVARGLVPEIQSGSAACRNLTLIWVVKHKASLEALYPMLEDLAVSCSKVASDVEDFSFAIQLYYTAEVPDVVSDSLGEKLQSSSRLPESPRANPSKALSSPAIPKRESSLHIWSDSVSIHLGRPPLARITDEAIAQTPDRGGLGMGVCGPENLVVTMESLARTCSHESRRRVGVVDIHAERFSL